MLFSLIAFYSINDFFFLAPQIYQEASEDLGGSIKRFTLRRRTSFKPGQVHRNMQTTNKQLVPTGSKPEKKLKYHPSKTTLSREDQVFPTCMLLWPHWLPWNWFPVPCDREQPQQPLQPLQGGDTTQHRLQRVATEDLSVDSESLTLRREGSSEIIETAVPVQCPNTHRGYTC